MKKLITHPFGVVCVLSLWWLVFFTLAILQITDFRSMRDNTLILYTVFIAFFFIGGALSAYKYSNKFLLNSKSNVFFGPCRFGKKANSIVSFALLVLLMWQFFVMLKVDFFSYTYIEYNRMLRGGGDYGFITKTKFGDHFYKLVVYPCLILVYLVALTGCLNRVAVSFIIANLILFTIIWQVNYPLIFVVYTLFLSYLFFSPSWFNKAVLPIIVLGLCLVSAAFVRYGGASWGVFEHYFVNYNLIGFHFFDAKFNDSNSVLHELSYGRSLLGAIDQYADLLFRPLGSEYLSASLQNVTDNMQQIDIGESEEKLVNAFGTMAFTSYRDFGWLGIVFVPFIYGYSLIFCYSKCAYSWRHRALYVLLCYGWMTGNSVSPFDHVYFVFSIVFLVFFFRFRINKNG